METTRFNFKNSSNCKMLLQYIAVAILFFAFTGTADAQSTLQGLKSFYTWLKPLVNVILACATIFAVAKAIIKTFMKHQEAGMEWTMVVIALVLWGLWITFANEIIGLFGNGPNVTF